MVVGQGMGSVVGHGGGGNRSDNISAHIGNVLRPSDNTQCFPIFIFMSIVNIRNKLSQML